MKDKVLIQNILDHYTEAEQVVKNLTFESAREHLIKRNMEHGICHFMIHTLDRYIDTNQEWINRNKYGSFYWCITPFACTNKNQLMQAINYRIGILKREIND